MIVCSFSGAAADLPPRKRDEANVLAALRQHPRVSVWDMSEHAWLREAIASLERQRLIRDDKREPYPWIRYAVIEEASNG